MPILVVCPGCRKRFQVGEQFAGKTGPCPACKAPIKIPTKAEEVQVHAPAEFSQGGRGKGGKLVTKPIARQQARLNPLTAAIIAAACVVVLLVAWVGGRMGIFEHYPVLAFVGLLIVSPPLVVGGYSVLRDDELEPYRGRTLYLRAGLCALAFAVLWPAFGYFAANVDAGEYGIWLAAPPFIVAGAMAALAALDFDFANAALLYAFYVAVTVLLRWAAGLGWVWEMQLL